jgi:hypothetical protein
VSGTGLLADAVRAATSASVVADAGLTDCHGTVVRMFGTAAGVAYRLDHAEVARRREHQLGALTDLDVLDALMGLPVGMPVEQSSLTKAERALVDRLPAGVVEHRGEQLVRLAAAPLSVQSAVVAARNWKTGLKQAGRFAPFCVRAILLPAVPADVSELQTQASFFGVGVGVSVEGQMQLLVEPAPYEQTRHTPAQWWFAEEAYRQISEQVTEQVSEAGEEAAARPAKATREARPTP